MHSPSALLLLLLGLFTPPLLPAQSLEQPFSFAVKIDDHDAEFSWLPSQGSLRSYVDEFATRFSIEPPAREGLFKSAWAEASARSLVPLVHITVYCREGMSYRTPLYENSDLATLFGGIATHVPLTPEDGNYIAAVLKLQQRTELRPSRDDHVAFGGEMMVVVPSCVLGQPSSPGQPSSTPPLASLASPATAHVQRGEIEFLVQSAIPPVHLDKTGQHMYEALYGKYISPLRSTAGLQLLEIGLGCDSAGPYPIGTSTVLWRRFLPKASLFVAEFNATCIDSWKKGHPELFNVTYLQGDQSDVASLRRWIAAGGAGAAGAAAPPFDVIIDDGGHTNKQQLTSLATLFNEGLRPGGVYILEDLQVSYVPGFTDFGELHTTRVLMGLIERLVLRGGPRPPSVDAAAGGLVLRGLKSVDCFAEACVLVKCSALDRFCEAVEVAA